MAEAEAKRSKSGPETAAGGEEACGPRISFLEEGGALLWRADDILTLRAHRIGGQLVGADFRFPSQNHTHGTPLAVAPEELATVGAILHLDIPESHRIDSLKARVFREMHRRGFWLARGTSFGADYLVYAGEPSVYHAAHLLVIKPWDEATSVLSYVTVARLGTAVKKTALIGSQRPDGTFWIHELKWLGV